MDKNIAHTSPSRRFRLRVSRREKDAFARLLRLTRHRTKSGAVRGALALYRQVMSARDQGFVVTLRHLKKGDELELPNVGEAADGGNKGTHDSYLELRLSPEDLGEVDALSGLEAGASVSDIVRRAVCFHAAVAEPLHKGYALVAKSAAGEMLWLSQNAMVGRAGKVARGVAESGAKPEPPGKPGRAAGGSSGGLVLNNILPQSLMRELHDLAADEGCSIEVLVADMLRASVTARSAEPEKRPAKEKVAAEESASGGAGEQMTFDILGGDTYVAGKERRSHHAPGGAAVAEGAAAPRDGKAAREGWALVLAQDAEGHPAEQIVPPESVIPLEPEDFLPALPPPEE